MCVCVCVCCCLVGLGFFALVFVGFLREQYTTITSQNA